MTAPPAHRETTRRGERGSATVEFALVLPLVLLVAVALVQLGLVLRDQLLVADSARAAAREAAVSADEQSVRTAAQRSGLDPDGVSVAIARSGGRGSQVRVGVSYQVPPLVPFVSWLFPESITLSAEATARQEFEV